MTVFEIILVSCLAASIVMVLQSLQNYIANKLLIKRLERVMAELDKEQNTHKKLFMDDEGNIVRIKDSKDIH
jgi:hypothetical protein